MKTLKKTLCLVLAVVMVVGVLVLPANAATTTAADTDATAAFNTLNEYGVMYGVDANNTPALNKNINRQDMAAIIYRIMTGDTAGTYVANYAGSANTFADSATFATWAKGYIGYVRNNGIFMGDEKGNFKPTDNITGDEVLTVLLRCIGYGKNNEFTGAYWAENAETLATQIHLFGGKVGTTDRYSVKADMSQVINRGTVAKLTCNAVDCPMVTYFNGEPSIYRDNAGRPAAPNAGGETNPKLIDTGSKADDIKYDDWGVPSQTFKSVVYFNYPQTTVETSTETSLKPVKEYWTAVTQCDVADDLNLADETDFAVYVNGKDNKTTITLDPINTVAKIGAQGRHTLIYDLVADAKNTPDTIIYIDTLLAEVTNVVAPTFDARGHVKTPASLTLKVYTNDTTTETAVQEKTDGTTYAYAKGDMLLVNYIQKDLNKADATVDVSGTDASHGAAILGDNDAAKGKNVKIVDKATAFDGKQTTIYYNQDKHKIDNVDYNDNNRFHLDQADTTGGTYTWYLDNSPEGKNLIGSKIIKSEASFGVITRIWAEIANGTTSIKANVTYVDGHTGTIDVGRIVFYKAAAVNTEVKATGTDEVDYADAVYVNSADTGAHAAMSIADHKLYVSNSYEENLNATDANDIIGDHLFKIVAGTTCTLIEVGGNGTNNNRTDDPKVDYRGMGNATTTIKTGVVSNSSASTGTVLVDDETRFLIKTGGAGIDALPYTFTTVVGYTNIGKYVSGEVDYASVDEDGYAEVVYITAAAESAIVDHIFFSKSVKKTDVLSGADTWELQKEYDTSTGIYTIYGWLDGVEATVKVTAASLSDTTDFGNFVNTATGNQLWLLTITNGLVTGIDGKRSDHVAVNETTYSTGVQLNNGSNGMDNPGSYANLYLMAYKSKGTSGTESVDGNVLKLGDNRFNITTVQANPTVGSWADVTTADTIVYLVYNGDKVVTQAYVAPKDTGSSYSPGTTNPTCDIVLSAVSATFENSSHTLTINFTLTNGSSTMVGVDQTKVKVSGKIQSQALGTGEWSDLGTFTDLSPAGAIASGTATSVTSTTAWSGNLNTNQNYRVVYTITFDGDTVGTADTPAGVAVS